MQRTNAPGRGVRPWRLGLMFSLVLTMGCNHPIFYQPRPYGPHQVSTFLARPGTAALTDEIPQGEQTAFYLPPPGNPHALPDQVWVLFSGIRTLALDWMPWLEQTPDRNTGFLLVDYPGYGNSQGTARAHRILHSSHMALNALAQHLGVDRNRIESRMGILGHSLGAGTALQFSVEVGVKRLILVSPFTDLKETVAHRYGPLLAPIINRFNP